MGSGSAKYRAFLNVRLKHLEERGVTEGGRVEGRYAPAGFLGPVHSPGRGTGLGVGIVKGADMGCRDSEWVCQGKVWSMDVGSVYSAFGLMCNLTVRSCA